MKISQQIISKLKDGGVDFFLSVPCKLLANMITILEADKEVFYSAIPREEEGMGIPAGIAASLRFPKRTVFSLVGDGGALMTGSELATAVAKKAKLNSWNPGLTINKTPIRPATTENTLVKLILSLRKKCDNNVIKAG